MNDENGDGGVGDDGVGDASEKVPDDAGAAVGAQDYEACPAVVGDFDDAFPGRCCLDRHAFCSEPGFLGQRGSVGGGVLRRVFYFGCVLGVEMLLADGYESDVCRLPDTEDESVAAGCEFAGGLLDREPG